MPGRLFDTNHLSAAVDDRGDVRGRPQRMRRAGHRFGTCVPVLCELEVRLIHTRNRDHNMRVLRRLLETIRI